MTIRNYPHASRTVESFDVPSPAIGQFYFQGNETATVIAQQNVFYPIVGTPTEGILNNGFINGSDRITCLVSKLSIYLVKVVLNFSSGNNNQIDFGVFTSRLNEVKPESIIQTTANSSGRQENVVVQALVAMAKDDYFEVHVRNTSAATNVTVTNINVIVTEVAQ